MFYSLIGRQCTKVTEPKPSLNFLVWLIICIFFSVMFTVRLQVFRVNFVILPICNSVLYLIIIENFLLVIKEKKCNFNDINFKIKDL